MSILTAIMAVGKYSNADTHIRSLLAALPEYLESCRSKAWEGISVLALRC